MIRLPPDSPLTDTRFPYRTLFGSAPAAATEPRRRKAGTRCWSHHARPSRIPASARVGHRPARRVFVAERATSEHPVRRAVAVHDHRRGEPCRIQPTANHHPIEHRRLLVVALVTAQPPLRNARVPPKFRIFRPEEHTSELQSLMRISYAVFCLT